MNKILSFFYSGLLFTAVLMSGGCKKNYDQPPGPADLDIVANTTIAKLKALHKTTGQIDAVTEDWIISGIVTANDKSGNLYKEIYIEDSTGAIKLMLDATGLYTNYPVGRRVYVYCKGLYISDYNRLMQLGSKVIVSGAPAMEGILNSEIPKYVKAGSINNPVEPMTVTLSQLGTTMSDNYIGRLVKLEGYEVAAADTAKTWADTSAYKADQNINIQGCGPNSKTIIRSSGYAKFAGVGVPKGNGSFTAIYTVYNTTKQFIIRDTSDVQFTGARCGSGPVTTPRITIGQLRQLYPSANARIKITNPTSIEGVVISDVSNGNISAGNFILQQGGSGILVYVGGATITYNVGDSIILDITNDSLITYAGSLELKRMNTTLPPATATGRQVTPAVRTIAQINSGLSKPLGDSTNPEATLVRIQNASFSPATGTYGGSKTISDGTGTITMYTRTTASFSTSNLPTAASTITCYPLMYNTTKQVIIRNLGDVQ